MSPRPDHVDEPRPHAGEREEPRARLPLVLAFTCEACGANGITLDPSGVERHHHTTCDATMRVSFLGSKR